jgi:DNA repair protein RecN (Recombination protein N)
LIETLRIENLAIVDEAELELGPGLNVLTGETGAGKSIVLGALSLLVGARAESGTLREGATQGGVEALVRTDGVPALEAELRARDLLAAAEASDADRHELVVRRTLTATGRSRARVGGQMVPVSTLAELLGERVEISSQHSSQALLRAETHGLLLDEAGGLLDARAEVAARFEAVRDLDEELERLRERAAERERARDFLAFQLAEIDEVGLEPGELATLEADHGRLAHAESLRTDGAEALAALRGDDATDGAAATDRVAAAVRVLEHMARVDPGLGELVGRLRGLDEELADVARELDRYVDRIDGDPAALARLDERIAQVERLRRKYGRDEESIFARRAELAEELAAVEGADARIGVLEGERGDRLAALDAAARKLSAGRRKAAKKLARAVEAGLRDLAMPEARFTVRLDAPAHRAGWPEGATSGPTGAEAPEFLMSANAGGSLRPLRKVASGGELSRVFLALKNALRQAGGGMVLVFDEVDAGVGGRAAERVGRALADLAAHHQVLCITHLPQIAAFASRHFRVEKSAQAGRTQARVTPLDDAARVEEIARMAGGEAITDTTRRHARALLRAASAPRG